MRLITPSYKNFYVLKSNMQIYKKTIRNAKGMHQIFDTPPYKYF